MTVKTAVDHRHQPPSRARLRRGPAARRTRLPRGPHRPRRLAGRAAGRAAATGRSGCDRAAPRPGRPGQHARRGRVPHPDLRPAGRPGQQRVRHARLQDPLRARRRMGAVRSALETDVIGPWALVQSVLPLLTAAPAARVVNVSSLSSQQVATGLDLGAPMRAPAHSMAKYMLDALTAVLARALADTPVLVNAVDPGNTATHPERGDDENDRPAAESARDIVGPPPSAPTARPGASSMTGGPWPAFSRGRENTVTGTGTAAAGTDAQHGAPLVDPGRHRPGPADDRARRHDREHRAARRPEGPRLLERRPAVDRHRLLARLRQPAAAVRPGLRPGRAPGDVPGRPGRPSPAPPRSAAPRPTSTSWSPPAPCRAWPARCSPPPRSRC